MLQGQSQRQALCFPHACLHGCRLSREPIPSWADQWELRTVSPGQMGGEGFIFTIKPLISYCHFGPKEGKRAREWGGVLFEFVYSQPFYQCLNKVQSRWKTVLFFKNIYINIFLNINCLKYKYINWKNAWALTKTSIRNGVGFSFLAESLKLYFVFVPFFLPFGI